MTLEITAPEVLQKAAEWLANGWYKHVIKRALFQEFGEKWGLNHVNELRPPLFEAILSGARDILREEIPEDFEDTRMASLQFYRSIVSDPLAETKDRMKAQERIDNILGHDARFKQPGSPKQTAKVVQDYLRLMDKNLEEEEE